MLIGAHVSRAGGLAAAQQRGVERGCDAIQIFHQSPRAWKPVEHDAQDIERFRSALADGPVRSVVIHAVYLINCAAKERQLRERSLAALVHALRLGDAIGADGVVVHPGSQVREPYEESLARVGDAIRHALAESERCPLLLENTAGAGGTLGRSFGELADLLERGGGGGRGASTRLGTCLDCCHMLASGFDIGDAPRLAEVVDAFDRDVGLDRLRCLHVNDSKTPLGSLRDRHENLPDGELGRPGLAAFLSEPRFEGLPALLEVPGPDGKGPDVGQIETARELRAEGLAERG